MKPIQGAIFLLLLLVSLSFLRKIEGKKWLSTLAWKRILSENLYKCRHYFNLNFWLLSPLPTSSRMHDISKYYPENDWTFYCSDILTSCDWYCWPLFWFLSITICLHSSALNKRFSCCWCSSLWHIFYFHMSHQIKKRLLLCNGGWLANIFLS